MVEDNTVLRSYALTDIGQKRQLNQDYIYASETPVGNLPNLFIVADGMGGHNAGDFASRFAVEEFEIVYFEECRVYTLVVDFKLRLPVVGAHHGACAIYAGASRYCFCIFQFGDIVTKKGVAHRR